MAKASILSHIGEGQYQILLDLDTTKAEQKITEVVTAIWLSRHPLAVSIIWPSTLVASVVVLVLSEGPV